MLNASEDSAPADFEKSAGDAGFTLHAVAPPAPVTGAVTVGVPFTIKPGNGAVLMVRDAAGGVTLHVSNQAIAPPPPSGSKVETLMADEVAAPVPAQSVDIVFDVPTARLAVVAPSPPVPPEAAAADGVEELAIPFVHGIEHVAEAALKVLEYPLAELVTLGAKKWMRNWDESKHPPTVRWFPPTGGISDGEVLTATSWPNFDRANGPVLLFVHGIFSSCKGGFGSIDNATWAALRAAYGNRIIGYDHPTAGFDPIENAQYFLDQIPDGVVIDLDVVCHSRGGLVSRVLAGQASATGTSKVNIRKIVFAATPNGGSEIANTDGWSDFIDRMATFLTSRVVGAVPVVSEGAAFLAGVLEIVKILAVGIADALPGLDAIRPTSDLFKQFANYAGATPEYYAAEADYRPPSVLAHIFDPAAETPVVAADAVNDAVFPDIRNDVCVPTHGVGDPTHRDEPQPTPGGVAIAGFPVDPKRIYPIGPGSQYWHCTYFQDPDFLKQLLAWLVPVTPSA